MLLCMHLYDSSKDYLFHLQTTSSADAKRMWRQSIKDKWNHKCAYCGNTENLTIDHIIPQCKGGSDFLTNVVCCCRFCNNSKSHTNWEEWYYNQDFFTKERYKQKTFIHDAFRSVLFNVSEHFLWVYFYSRVVASA